MKQKITTGLALIGAVAILAGAFLLWQNRSWRAVVTVNGRSLTAHELEMRGMAMMKEACDNGHLMIPKSKMAESKRHFCRKAAATWIMKEVFLDEAVARGIVVTAEDENATLAQDTVKLAKRNMTVDEFLKSGTLPEQMMRADFNEAVLVRKFLTKEVKDKIVLKPEEIENRIAELQRMNLAYTKPGEKAKIKTDRKTAINTLMGERYRAGVLALYRELCAKASISSSEFPELVKVNDNISSLIK